MINVNCADNSSGVVSDNTHGTLEDKFFCALFLTNKTFSASMHLWQISPTTQFARICISAGQGLKS